MIQPEEAERCGLGNYPVTWVPNIFISLKGTTDKMAAAVWLPFSEADPRLRSFVGEDETQLFHKGSSELDASSKVPVVVEYLPYRKSDVTAARDYIRHTWFCSHGIAVARIDMRGSGDSTGLYFDEYLEQEQNDCIEAFDWLCMQPWCNGNIGMYGKSWGGFNGLQVAFLKPPALKAVISLYSTDDSFKTDVSHLGGCVIPGPLVSWASEMFLRNTLPPQPRYFNSIDSWKTAFKTRLQESGECWAKRWLERDTMSDFWAHGSIATCYDNVECPVLLMGGLRDMYVDAAFRMTPKLNERSRILIGPWSHDWPDCSNPGPNIDFLQECLTWWKAHLFDGCSESQQAVRQLPRLRVFIRGSHLPDPSRTNDMVGTWKTLDENNVNHLSDQFDDARTEHNCTLNLGDFKSSADTKSSCLVPKPSILQAFQIGEMLSFGGDDGPGDQTLANQHSLLFTSNPLENDVILCGFSELKVKVGSEAKHIALFVRVCELQADDSSTLVTKGCCNLENMDGESTNISVVLGATTYHFAAGSRIQVALCGSLFPLVLHRPQNIHGDISFDPNQTSLVLQILPKDAERWEFEKPMPLLKVPSTIKEPSVLSLMAKMDLGSLKSDLVITKEDTYGSTFHQPTGIEIRRVQKVDSKGSLDLTSCGITAIHDANVRFYNPEMIDVQVKTRIDLAIHDKFFDLRNQLSVSVNGTEFHSEKWNEKVERKST